MNAGRSGPSERTFPCPHCGEPVARRATFCKHCGASDEMGWDTGGWWEDEVTGGYSDDDFDYDEYAAREFGEPQSGDWKRTALVIIIVLICIAIAAIQIGF